MAKTANVSFRIKLMTTMKPIRVLHSFGGLVKGGIETWLMNIVRLRSKEVQFDFFLNLLGGPYEAEARSYGCRIHIAPPIRQLGKYHACLERVLNVNQYDVYHSHVDEFAGDSVKAAAMAGVPVRVGHCHNTVLARGQRGFEMQVRSWRFKTINRSRMLKYATDILACSSDAGRFFMGTHWGEDPRSRVLFCAVPLDEFNLASSKWSRDEFRNAHGIPRDAIVVGHVGSMGPTPQKNHSYILEIFAELARRDQRYYLYLAGDGPDRPALEKKVKQMKLKPRVMMPGLFDDIPSLMVHGFDVFLLPSLWEGLPVAGLEAVASGLATVCSDCITKDFTAFFSTRVVPLSLKEHPSVWADWVEEAIKKRISVDRGIVIFEKSPFSINSSLNDMIALYQNRLELSK
jgi:glycosyltransferase involved in cell wall biosynthesis